MVALARSLERRVRDFIMLGLGWHMFSKMWCFIHQLPQELVGQWGQGQGTCKQPPALPLATPGAPFPPCQSLGFPQGNCPSLCPGTGSSFGAPSSWDPSSPSRGHLRHPHISDFSLCCSIYLNVSLILHLPLQGRIHRKSKNTVKKHHQTQRKSEQRYPVPLFVPSIFFSCPFYSSFTAVRAYYQHLQLPFTKDLWVFPCLLPLLYLLTYSII